MCQLSRVRGEPEGSHGSQPWLHAAPQRGGMFVPGTSVADAWLGPLRAAVPRGEGLLMPGKGTKAFARQERILPPVQMSKGLSRTVTR